MLPNRIRRRQPDRTWLLARTLPKGDRNIRTHRRDGPKPLHLHSRTVKGNIGSTIFREIDQTRAHQILTILVEECGHQVHDQNDVDTFVRAISTEFVDDHKICREYRFCGALGFGGKFRNNGNRDNTPHVDCYPESETPQRIAMIEAANRRLAIIFSNTNT